MLCRVQIAQRASLAAASGDEDDVTDVELSAGHESRGAGRPAEVLGKRRRAVTYQPQPTGSTEDSGQCSSGGETGTVAGGRRTRRSVRRRVARTWDDIDGVSGGASPMESDEDASDQDGGHSSLALGLMSGYFSHLPLARTCRKCKQLLRACSIRATSTGA